jgi:putative tryptophan/tyrosine transport system substrate-binding protein
MRRRQFLSMIGVAAVSAVPLRAYAQQKAKVYRLAVVNPSAPVGDMSETGNSQDYRAFFQRLRELGYVEGQNIAVERYSGEGRTEHVAELAREVVRSKPDVIDALGDRLVREFKAATDTIPVVAGVSDPVALGIAVSIAKPGGNITGGSGDAGAEIAGKWLELLHEMVPAASRVGLLASHAAWELPSYTPVLREAAQRLKISLVGPPLDAPFDDAEYRRVYAAMAREGVDALIVNNQYENITHRKLIVELADEYRLPAIYWYREFVTAGGLMAYSPDVLDAWRNGADQIVQILNGAKLGDIPFWQPSKFKLTINLKTAKALGLTVPPTLVIAADEVIE